MAESSEPIMPIPENSAVAKKYKLGEPLGIGTYGVTYVCTHSKSNEKYACKIISKCKLDSEDRRQRMQREKEILLFINSFVDCNLISTKKILEDDSCHYIMMELCEGGTLRDHVIINGAFPENLAAVTIKQIVRALEACHKNGIVHRALKPANVVYEINETNSDIRLIDFGFATYYEEGKPLMGTFGTLMAMAPKMFYDGGYGPKVDIWSAGIILFILLTGKYPWCFRGTKEMLLFFDRDFATFQTFSFLNLSEGAKDLLRCMLTIDVNDRWSASQVMDHPWIYHIDLQYWLMDLGLIEKR